MSVAHRFGKPGDRGPSSGVQPGDSLEMVNRNPASGVRRNSEEKRNRFLNRDGDRCLGSGPQRSSEPVSANAIKLLMLTGARRGEVLGASWKMFDLENGIWTKPSAHTKQRLIHRVP